MTIRTISAKEVKLLSITDLRPIDWNSGMRLAIPASACNTCDRCEKLHVKVYEVVADGVIYHVGSGCCRRMFGWEPTKAEVVDKERSAEEVALKAALEKAAQEFIEQINQLEAPRPQFKCMQEVLQGHIAVWHADGVVIASKLGMAGLDAEKRQEFAQQWRAKKLQEALKEHEAAYKANRAETKRAKQLIQAVKAKVA